jgi:hypothetical protein
MEQMWELCQGVRENNSSGVETIQIRLGRFSISGNPQPHNQFVVAFDFYSP